MSEDVKQYKSPPRQWPRLWLRDEKFWKDVTSQALGGVLVVVFGYLVAVSNGLLRAPTVQHMVIGALLVAAGVGLFSLFVWKYQAWIAPLHDKISHPWNEILDMVLKLVVGFGSTVLFAVGFLRFFGP